MPLFYLMMAQALLSFYSQYQTASAQASAIEDQANRQQGDRQRVEDEAARRANAEMNEVARQRQADLALFDAVAGEYGGGASVSRGRAVRSVQAGERAETIRSNASGTMSQLGFEGRSLQSQANSRLAAIDQPSILETGLQIGSAYLQYGAPKPAPRKTR
jgi:hypothetical protein